MITRMVGELQANMKQIAVFSVHWGDWGVKKENTACDMRYFQKCLFVGIYTTCVYMLEKDKVQTACVVFLPGSRT